MIRDSINGVWQEATITINGIQFTFAESMSVRVAISSFRMSLADNSEFKQALGKIGDGYDHQLQQVEAKIMGGR